MRTSVRTSRRTRLVLLAVVATLGATLSAVAPATADQSTKRDVRFGGADRYSTAAQLFGQFGDQPFAVVANGENFPDALSAAFFGRNAAQGGPSQPTGVLLTRKGDLPAVTRKALIDAAVFKVFILGGTSAVSTAVAREIGSIEVGEDDDGVDDVLNGPIQVIRLAGTNRYDTNRVVNTNAVNVGSPQGLRPTVLLASGENFPDALSTGPVAFRNDIPLILSNGRTLGSAQIQQLDIFKPNRVVIVGGTSAVSPQVEQALRSRGLTVNRIAGVNRQDTAAQVARWTTSGVTDASGTFLPGLGFGSTAGISTGLGFADALAAGPVLGQRGASLLLAANATDPSAPTLSYLRSKTAGPSGITELFAIGGTSVVSNALMNTAALAVGG